MKSFILFIVLSVCRGLAGQTYSKLVDIIGPAFYDEFSFYTAHDPTHGRVYALTIVVSSILTGHVCFSLFSTYVDQRTAQEHNLTYATDNAFILRADHTTYLIPSDPGRRSARIVSRKQYETFVAVYVARVLRQIIHNHISIASTCVTYQKGAGELLSHALSCFTSNKLHLEHGQPSGL